jgi:hypothetical protein
MGEHTAAPIYGVLLPNGTRQACGASVWLMETEAKMNAAVTLIQLDCGSALDMSRGENVWLNGILDDEKPYLVVIWTIVTNPELMDMIQCIIQDYQGTRCSWEEAATVEIANDVILEVEQSLRDISKHGSDN